MSPITNERWVVAKRGEGDFNENDFKRDTQELPPLQDGEVRVQVVYASCDPTQLGWSRADTYMPAVPLGDVMRAGGVGVVKESKSSKFKAGDHVSGLLGFQKFWQGEPSELQPAMPDISLEDASYVFSMIGPTSWALYEIGNPKSGETVVVSGAAGAVGMLVCQLAKARGCRCVGIAGSEKKLAALKEIGVDAAVNYKDKDFPDKLKEACPKGVDVYFENVGGMTTEAVWPLFNTFARIVACGMIAMYTQGSGLAEGDKPGLPFYNTDIVTKRLHIQGFICFDYHDKWPTIFQELQKLVEAGKLKSQLDVIDGFENTISALGGLFKGDNLGKRVVRYSQANK